MRHTFHNLVTSLNGFAIGLLLVHAITKGDVKCWIICVLLVASIVFNVFAEIEGNKK